MQRTPVTTNHLNKDRATYNAINLHKYFINQLHFSAYLLHVQNHQN